MTPITVEIKILLINLFEGIVFVNGKKNTLYLGGCFLKLLSEIQF